MKRLPCTTLTLAQFLQTGPATYPKHKPQICLPLEKDLLQVKRPHTSDSVHTRKRSSLKPRLLLFHSVHKCFKSFSEMNSVMPPAVEMTLGLYGFKRKTNQPTKAVSETRCPARWAQETCLGPREETKSITRAWVGGVGSLTERETQRENDVWVCRTLKG